MSSEVMIDEFLSRRAMALFGMSRSGKKFGNYAYRVLVAKGYRVYPVHPTASSINGISCYSDVPRIPEHIETALIILPPAQAIQALRKAAAGGVRKVWLQQGSESPEVLAECEKLGLDTISGECILMFAKPAGFHKAHRWLWGVLGKLPA